MLYFKLKIITFVEFEKKPVVELQEEQEDQWERQVEYREVLEVSYLDRSLSIKHPSNL